MERNNGKIAIAIVAMFVVALSIVGFTYAYFVANVEGNTDTNVTVTSGELILKQLVLLVLHQTGKVMGYITLILKLDVLL